MHAQYYALFNLNLKPKSETSILCQSQFLPPSNFPWARHSDSDECDHGHLDRSGVIERMRSLQGSTHSDRDSAGAQNQRNKGLSFRRNIQMNLDIEKCDNSLDSSIVSEVGSQYRIHIHKIRDERLRVNRDCLRTPPRRYC